MKLTIRIYKRHDLDLLYLCRQESEFDFKESLKLALKGYIKNEPLTFDIPKGNSQSVSSLPTVVQLHIMLDPTEDKDILDWSKTITKGRRNNMIKNIFRNCFPPIEAPYKKNSENTNF